MTPKTRISTNCQHLGQSPRSYKRPEIFRSMEKTVFINLLSKHARSRLRADTSWAYSGMGAGLSKSAFGAIIAELKGY